METQLFLHGVLLPSAIAFAVVIAIARRHPRWMGVAILIAFVVGVGAFDPIVDRPTTGSWTNAVLALGAMIAAATGFAGMLHHRLARGLACAICALLGSLVFAMPEWSGAESRLGLAAGLGASCALLLPPGMHRGGFSFWCAQSVALAGASALALWSGFAKLALPVGAVSATCGWIALLAVASRPHRAVHADFTGTVAIAGLAAVAAATVHAFDTGATPSTACLCAGVAPLGCWLGELPPFRGSRMASGLARILGCGAIAGLAVFLAIQRPGAESSDAYAVANASGDQATIGMDASSR
jgi:hypothetical protein